MPDIWEYIPLEEFSLPAAPTHEAVYSGLGRSWKWVKQLVRPAPPIAAAQQREFAELSAERLRQAIPPPNWEHATAALESAWEKLSAQRVAVVGPPGSGVAEATALLGQRRGAVVVAPPRCIRCSRPMKASGRRSARPKARCGSSRNWSGSTFATSRACG